MKKLICTAAAASLWTAGSMALAADFDGSKKLICAPVEVIDCSAGDECVKGSPKEMGGPSFFRIDFAKKQVVGPKRTTDIRTTEKNAEQLVLQGSEPDYSWTIALEQVNGGLTATMVGSGGVLVLFGSCTPL